MNDNPKIRYIFENDHKETETMAFTIVEVEGMVGGFMNHVLEHLRDVEFGEIKSVRRIVAL